MLYARLEETSFRSGAAASAAVLVVAAVVITLAVMPGDHRAVPARAAGAAQVPSSAALSAPAPAPSAARPARSASDRAGNIAPDPDDMPDAAAGRTATRQDSWAPWRHPTGPAWPQTRWPPADPPPAWLPAWLWDHRWPGPQWPGRDRP